MPAAPTTTALELANVSCTFVSKDDPGQRYTAVRDVNLSVGAGEFVSVVGPTGCGKSTLLNVAAGLLAPSTGEVTVFGQSLVGLNRRAGYMFQAESLMPWRTARQNVMAGLEFRGVDDAGAQADEWLKRVGLGGFGDRYPHQLSGGMRKRVSLAQTLVLDPLQPLVGLRRGVERAAELEPGHHVGTRGAPRHQALGLEHVAGPPVDAGERFAESRDRSR